MKLRATSTFFSCVKASLLWAALLVAGVFVGMSNLNAQGWELYYGGNSEDFGRSILQAPNLDYLTTGFSESFGADGDLDVYVIRTDVDGRQIWSNVYDEGFVEHGYSIIKATDGGYLIAGDIRNTQLTNPNVYLLKIADDGTQLWSQQYGGAGTDIGWRVISSPNNGGYLIAGGTDSSGNGEDDVFLVKVDEEGNQEWSQAYGTAEDDFGRSAVETTDGYLIVGSAYNQSNDSRDVYLLKVDFNCVEQWSKFFGTADFDEGYDIVATDDGNFAIIGNAGFEAYLIKVDPDGNEIWSRIFNDNLSTQAYDLIKTGNGDLVITGFTELDATNINAFLARYDTDGNLAWNNTLGRGNHVDEAHGVAQTHDKGFIVVGYNSLLGISFNDVTLTKVNANGDTYTNHLQGKVFIDEDSECDLDTGEPGLNDWIVKAEGDNQTFFGTSDENGNFDIILEEGDYEVSVLVKNPYWESCVAAFNVSFSSEYDTLFRNFPILKDVSCAYLEVDVSTPVVQNCENIGYTVSYCNNGTVEEPNPVIELILDDDLVMTNASIPFTFTPDSLYVFDLDALGIEECGSFFFTASSACDGVEGQAYTVSARILPDSICLPTPGWDMSSIDVNGYCDGDTIRFTIRNEGTGDMIGPQEFIVIEDHIMLTPAPTVFQLKAQEDTLVAIGAGNEGNTYRIIAAQSPGHPGNSYPTVAVEGCTTGSNFSTGFTTELQEDENDPFVSIDVQEAISSTDYIFLRGYPKGYLENGENLIPANTPIQYHIYFQNSGTDTIQRLVIRDTLPESLELGTVVPGASSHPYGFEAYSNGVLKFTFDNLNLLPDGDTASLGFVQFKISQKPNNPEGTVIPNSAAVFLGYDEPVQTSTYTHVVGGTDLLTFVITDVDEPEIPGIAVNAYPNPFTSSIFFEVDGQPISQLTVTVFDLNGRVVRREKVSGNQLQLTRGNLLAGLYAYQLTANDQLISTGKIMVR